MYDCSKKTFTVYCDSKDLNIPGMPLNESYIPNKRACYTLDQLPYTVYVASGNSVRTLNTPSESPPDIPLSYDVPSTDHTIFIFKPGCAKEKIGYCYMPHEVIICYRKFRFHCSLCYFGRGFITVTDIP